MIEELKAIPPLPVVTLRPDTTGGLDVSVIVRVLLMTPSLMVPLVVAPMVMGYEPGAAVGVPDISPVLALIVSPAGSPGAVYELATTEPFEVMQ